MTPSLIIFYAPELNVHPVLIVDNFTVHTVIVVSPLDPSP